MRKLPVLVITLVMTLLFGSMAQAQQIWIDVRSDEEYHSEHIDGDTHIPLATLDAEALAARYGKDAEIMLYCRSGNRAGQAKTLLENAGFTKVSNAGGIATVRELRNIPAPQSSPSQ